MDDNYLDKKLKGILESAPEFEPEASDLLDMQKRLQGIPSGNRRSRGFLLLWALPLLFLLVFGAGFIYRKYDTLNRTIDELNRQITQGIPLDTIIEKQIIYQIDTVYQTIYREKAMADSQPKSGGLLSSSFLLSSIYIPNQGHLLTQTKNTNFDRSLRNYTISLLEMKPGSGFFPTISRPAAANSENEAKMEQGTAVDLPSLQQLPIKQLSSSTFTDLDLWSSLNNDVLKIRKNEINPIYYFLPVGFTLKAGGSPGILPLHETVGLTYSLGLSAEIELPQNRGLEMGGELLSVNLHSGEAEHFGNLPGPGPQNPMDRLHDLKAQLRYLQFYAGLRQRFLPNHKLQPAISFGIVANRPLRQQFAYEYEGPSGEYRLESAINAGSFSLQHIRVGLGTEYSLGRKFSLETEVQYQHSFLLNSNEYLKLRYWAFHLGINYHIFNK